MHCHRARQKIHLSVRLSVCHSKVDENPDYDNLDIVSRDAEDKYFDEDEEEEFDDEEEHMSE